MVRRIFEIYCHDVERTKLRLHTLYLQRNSSLPASKTVSNEVQFVALTPTNSVSAIAMEREMRSNVTTRRFMGCCCGSILLPLLGVRSLAAGLKAGPSKSQQGERAFLLGLESDSDFLISSKFSPHILAKVLLRSKKSKILKHHHHENRN